MIVRQLSRDPVPEPLPVSSGPRALARYRQVVPEGPEVAARARLTRLAALQGTAFSKSGSDLAPGTSQDIDVAQTTENQDVTGTIVVTGSEGGTEVRSAFAAF